ncbi:MAG: glycine betaine ABC transporter substrate-binding protein [Bacteroidetes bacterium]|nr:MAG: glycine betaine ABC transporter substrate-binding protein [Bacteroidota bacterium]
MERNLVVILITMLMLGSCVSPSDRKVSEQRQIKMLYTDWSESIAMTYLATILLERDMGFKVTTRMADVDEIFNDIATGEADLFLDVWLPATHSEYIELYGDRIEVLGLNYQPARTGLVVPDYMGVDNMEQLREYYQGPIVGIDSTAGIMRVTREALDAYNLPNELLVLSEEEMTVRLRTAVQRQKDIVITGWEPHWIFFRYDLRFLHDPQMIYMAEEQIYSIARTGFAEEFVHVATFLNRMVLTERQMNSLLFEMHLSPDPLEGVRKWIQSNEFVVNQWTRGLGPEREKIM